MRKVELNPPHDEVLFELAVTKAWLRPGHKLLVPEVIVALVLICRGSYRGVVEFLRDLLGVTVSLGCVHDVLQAAAQQASTINQSQDLSCIRVGLHDELFQGAMPVLAGIDARSTYCYFLAAADRRDADTWGVHLLDAAAQGLRPDYTVADAGQGLRAGQRAAWGDVPCHGDVFHIHHRCAGLANALQRLAQGATSRRKALQAGIGRAGQCAPDHEHAVPLKRARKAEIQVTTKPTPTKACGCAHPVSSSVPSLNQPRVRFDGGNSRITLDMNRKALALAVAAVLMAAPAWALPPWDGTTVLAGTVVSGTGPGKVPLGGANVAIYAAADPAFQLLASTKSSDDGQFRVALGPTASGRVLFAVAYKGATELVTLLGTHVPASVMINEMTTVSSAYALARLFQNGRVPAKPQAPLEVAVGMAHNLVSPVTGSPSEIMTKSPNADETNTWGLLGTLSNMLAPCVRESDDACRTLFALTTAPGEAEPKTTFQAMLSIARHPASSLRPLFALGEWLKVYAPNLAAWQGPDAAVSLTRLDAFTLGIKFNATGRLGPNGSEVCPFGGPANVAFDTNGYLWITNNVVQGTPDSSKCMIVLKPDGSPADGTGGAPSSPVLGGGLLGQGFGLGFDPSGTLWAGNFGWGTVQPTDARGSDGGSVSRFTASGEPLSPPYGFTSSLYKVQGTVSDAHGNIWMASFGNNRLELFPGGDPAAALPYYQDGNTLPFDIRLDSAGDAWVSYNGTRVVSKFTLNVGRMQREFTVAVGTPPRPGPPPTRITGGPRGLAVDTQGNAWVSNGDDNAIYAISRTGQALGSFGGGGVYGPWGVSLDSDQTVWVANFGPLGPAVQKFSISQLCGALTARCPVGLRSGDPISPASGYTLPSGGSEVHLHGGKRLYDPLPVPAYRPLMRLTSANVDMAGNVWCANNWKPDFAVDLTTNPGGDGMVVFVGLAAPVQPARYSAPPVSPFRAD